MAGQAKSSRVAGSKKGSIINRISLADFQSSTKIEAIREELERMMQRDPSGKAIVFSQFTSMLDLIAFRLQQVKFRCTKNVLSAICEAFIFSGCKSVVGKAIEVEVGRRLLARC